MPPKAVAKNADRGVLPVNAAARAAPSRAPAARLKLEIRRLPPGLTLTEFEETLGAEWKLAQGNVDWREYRQGKLKAPGKLPEQSRCYLHLVNEACVRQFEERFLNVVFLDKAGTHKNAELKHLSPTLGFAPNQRTPLQAKQRADNRQGTVDQDAEFIAFLEAETQPVKKPSAVDGADKAEKVVMSSTPLIDDLREKKANKAKAAVTKTDKKKEDEKKGHGRSASKEVVAEKDPPKTALQAKVEQAAKEAAKVLTKQVAGKAAVHQQQPIAKPVSPTKSRKVVQSPRQQNATPVQPAAAASPAPSSPAPNRVPQRQRANAEGIKKMLQKDLGIRPKGAPAARTPTNATSSAIKSPPRSVPPTPSTIQQPAPAPAPPTAPKVLPAPKSAAPSPIFNISTTKAYLKHANPSQGMTEMLILRSLCEFGECTNVTIDPRKGTAIAVFKDNEGLKKAMQAKRVTVANGAVEVLEFKEGPRGGGGGTVRGRGGFRGGRGGGGGGVRGGGVASATAAASPAATASTSPAAPTPAPS
ncbi:hypothetical protein LTR08_002279 [Meristemomyces frigidus]|nr:hypothetical protein LTR08_002279 [Meristemomyces frigidus]